VAPLLYRMASSTYFNMSILTSDFWGLCFGKFRCPTELGPVVLTAPRTGLGLYVRICSHGVYSAKPISRGTNLIGCTLSRTWLYWVASLCTFGTLPVRFVLSSIVPVLIEVDSQPRRVRMTPNLHHTSQLFPRRYKPTQRDWRPSDGDEMCGSTRIHGRVSRAMPSTWKCSYRLN